MFDNSDTHKVITAPIEKAIPAITTFVIMSATFVFKVIEFLIISPDWLVLFIFMLFNVVISLDIISMLVPQFKNAPLS